MTYISPILQNKLNISTNKQAPSTQSHHERAYVELQKRANEVKPNEAKAKLVDEGMLGNPITAIKDDFNDVKNFFKTVKTGEMGDNSLGRINDLGLKLGAFLIASFLALKSKTKTNAIMSYVGGATFIGMMSLWPKLFINIPARLVHGFRIDRKYISAQGDKKDFGLDNQFYVWDAYPEEQLRKDAKRAGIDYDSENGKEKIQRKIQKTTLQNRTLWMATAGFATPLLTSIIGNYVEPVVEKAVVAHDVNKVDKILHDVGFVDFIKSVKPEVRNEKELASILESAKDAPLEGGFLRDIAKTLFPTDFILKYKDIDDANALKDFKPFEVIEELRNIYHSLATLKTDDLNLDEILDSCTIKSVDSAFEALGATASPIDGAFGAFGATVSSIDGAQEAVDDARKLASLKNALDVNPSIQKLKDELGKLDFSKEFKEKVMKKADAISDKKDFFKFVEAYNKGPVAQLRARLKAYADLLNPVVGSKSESASTLEYSKAMKKIFSGLGFKTPDYFKLKDLQDKEAVAYLSELVSKAVKGTDADYKAFLESVTLGQMDDSVLNIIKQLQAKDTLSQIAIDETSINGIGLKGLNKALLGGDEEFTRKILFNVVENKKIDLDATRIRMLLCANFERRLAAGEFNGCDKEVLGAIKKAIYDGDYNVFKNGAYAFNEGSVKKVAGKVFDFKEFSEIEKDVADKLKMFIGMADDSLEKGKGLKKYLESIYAIFENGKDTTNQALDYTRCSSVMNNLRNFAKRLSNNKIWLHTFLPMTIILVAVTLLVQPLFGKIDKEFPEEKNGGAK